MKLAQRRIQPAHVIAWSLWRAPSSEARGASKEKECNARRVEIVRAMTGTGPLTIREVARLVGRDFKAVHSDVTMLANAGILQRTEKGAVEFSYDRVHVEFDMMAA